MDHGSLMIVPALEPLVAGVSHDFGMQHTWNPTRKRLLYFLSKGIYEYIIHIYNCVVISCIISYLGFIPAQYVTVTTTIAFCWIGGSQKTFRLCRALRLPGTRLSDLTTTERSGSEMPGMLGPSETLKKKNAVYMNWFFEKKVGSISILEIQS